MLQPHEKGQHDRKSGLATVMAEEALRAEVPVLMIDVKGISPISCCASLLLGPMTRTEIRRALGKDSGVGAPTEEAKTDEGPAQ